MKITHYPETDSIYIDLSNRPSFETKEINSDLNVDLDESGRPVGIDIHGNASQYVDIANIQFETAKSKLSNTQYSISRM
ncbi:PF10049 family protein [Leptospira santarosai]|uniref:PF10049 family protein n=1 Tax=Leptospira santarosai TaxID=28183 RepID=A0A2P1QTS4_9LEPT|nr:PF10049 family protein [Leptospira santarosai]